MNLVLITSIIKTPNKPLSYTEIRSYYTPEERFEQTKKTIHTVKEKIPNSKIMIVECSELEDVYLDYFTKNSDYFINLIHDDECKESCHSIYKALGEGTMTMKAIEYIKEYHIEYDNFFKISGRYVLTDAFDYTIYDNMYHVIRYNDTTRDNVNTALYKLKHDIVFDFYIFLKKNRDLMIHCIGYEYLFSKFIHQYQNIKIVDRLGVGGYIAVVHNGYISV